MSDARSHGAVHGIVLCLLFVIPSLSPFVEHLGWGWAIAYAALVAAVMAAVRRWSGPLLPWADQWFPVLVAGVFLGLVVVFAVGYPIEDGRGVGRSSDRDDGLDLAVARLLAGESPYYPPHPEIGPLSLLPGAILLGAPFAILGNSGGQNFLWLAVLLAALACHLGGRARGLLALGLLLGLSPAVQYEFISGGDMLANGIYVPVLAWLAGSRWSTPVARNWTRWASAILLGIGLASRPNFLLLLPLFGAWLWRRRGFHNALRCTSIVAGTAALVTLPFYLHDPAGFTPLPTANKLAAIDAALPWASRAVMAGAAALALAAGLAVLRAAQPPDAGSLFRRTAAIVAFPILAAVVLSSWVSGQLNLGFLHDRYGLMFLPAALMGWGMWLFPGRADPPRSADSSAAGGQRPCVKRNALDEVTADHGGSALPTPILPPQAAKGPR